MDKQVLRQVRERPPSTAPTTPATPTAPTVPTTTTTDPEPDDVRAVGEPRPKFRQLPLRFDDRVREWQAPVALDWPGKQAPMRATVLSEYFHVT